MANMEAITNGHYRFDLAPSLLSKKILCPAYTPAPFKSEDRLLYLGLHAIASLKVIARKLRLHHWLKSVERRGNGFRYDLEFEVPSGKNQLYEVKSAKNLKEVHKIQAALYWTEEHDEVILSNGEEEIPLTTEYIQSVQHRAEETCKLLRNNPELAAATFKPNSEICYICSNFRCPSLQKKGS